MEAGRLNDRPGQQFDRALRLHTQADYRHVFARGKRWQGELMQVVAARRGAAGPSRLGVVASRKVGPATVRNRLKRRVRELFRTGRHRLMEGRDVVVVLRPAARQATFAQLNDSWQQALTRLGLIVQ